MKSNRQKEYQKYLNSDEWKESREFFKQIHGNKCQLCDETEDLHIHHLNYDCLGNETVNDVVCLCKGCHFDAHKGRLKIWIFNKEEMEGFKKIKHIILDSKLSYLILPWSDLKIIKKESTKTEKGGIKK